MPPKTVKKQVVPVETPAVPESSPLEKLQERWIVINKELATLNEKKGPLETERDNVVKQMIVIMNKNTDVEDSTGIIETQVTEFPVVIDKVVSKTKAKTVKVDNEPTPTKKSAGKKTTTIENENESDSSVKPAAKSTVTKKAVVSKKTAVKDEVVVKPIEKVATKTNKVATKVIKGKPKLEEDSETEEKSSVPNKQGYKSSSDTDIESLSSCSSESGESGGEED